MPGKFCLCGSGGLRLIPIYIVSRVHEERFHTPRILLKEDIPFTVVVDDKVQEKKARDLGCKSVLVSGTTSLPDKRNWIIDRIAQTSKSKPKWYIGMDDNISGFTKLNEKLWDKTSLEVTNSDIKWRDLFRTSCSSQRFIQGLHELIEECERQKTYFGGIATCENPFFRARKFSYHRFVKGKVFVMKAGSGVRFKHPMGQDSYASALTMALFGKTVVLNYLHHISRWYEKGGLGNRAEREAKGLLGFLDATVNEFPGLVARAPGKNSALRFLKTSDAAVNKWRRENGYLKEPSLI